MLSYFHEEIWTTSNAKIELFLSNKTLSNELKNFRSVLSYCENQNGINREKIFILLLKKILLIQKKYILI